MTCYDIHELQLFAEILSVGWLVNALSVPPSLANLADGKLFWNWFCNVGASVVNPVIGLILGPLFGARGVVIGTTCALVSVALTQAVTRSTTARETLPRPTRGALVLGFVGVIFVSLRLFLSSYLRKDFEILAASMILCALFVGVYLVSALKSVRTMMIDAGVEH